MPFPSRAAAARLLAEKLAPYRGTHPLILAIPRGAVGMGKVLAEELRGELDVVLVRKLGAPGNAEVAIGSVDEAGTVRLNPGMDLPGMKRYLQEEAERQSDVLRARRALYTPVRRAIDPRGRIVIVVDDGVATGATMRAALETVRAKGPRTLIAAAAVMARDAAADLATIADDVAALETPADFQAVSLFFEEFPQLSDDEVVALLEDTPYSCAAHLNG